MRATPASFTRAIHWRRLDHAAQEEAILGSVTLGAAVDGGWRLRGTVRGLLPDGRAYDLRYRVDCAPDWVTREAEVEVHFGEEAARRTLLERDPTTGEWRRDGVAQPQVAGALDVDLGFTPATNTLPIRRLALAVGDEAPVRAAWLRFPELDFVPLEQRYARLAEDRYRYESGGGAFRVELEVAPDGIVTRYGAYWVAQDRR